MWLYAMLMMVITKLIRVIRNQLRSSVSPPPVYQEQQFRSCSPQLSVIANIPEQITLAQGPHSDGIALYSWWVATAPSNCPLTTHETVAWCYNVIFVLFVFLSVWPSISSLLARAVLWIFYLALRWFCSVSWWPLIRLNRSSKTNHTIKK